MYELGEGSAFTEDVTWLDRHVRIDVQRDAAAAVGWRVLSCTVGGLISEEAEERFAQEFLTEYMSTELGFSVLYPAVFTEQTVQEHVDGVSGRLADGSAGFEVRRYADGAGTDLTAYADSEHGAPVDAVRTINDEAGLLVERWTEGTRQHCLGTVLTQEERWTVSISWEAEKHPGLETLAEHMMNSMSVDALGVG